MKKLFFRFDFSPKIKKFLTTLHNTQEQAILWIIRQLLPFLFRGTARFATNFFLTEVLSMRNATENSL